VLITGAAGLIGSNVARTLIEQGEQVVGVDIRRPTETSVLAEVLDKMEFLVGDISDSVFVYNIIRSRKVDRILHGAAIVAEQADLYPIQAIRVNLQGTVTMLEAARIFPVKRVVVLSSSSVNGVHASRDLEDALTETDMDMPYGSMYPVHKLAQEGQVQVYRKLHGVSAVALRPSRVWGPGYARFDLPLPIELLIRDAVEGKDIVWPSGADIRMDVTYVRDLCQGIIQALTVNEVPSPVYTLSGGTLVSVTDVIDALRAQFPKLTIEVGPGLEWARGDIPYTIALKPMNDISRARNELGYRTEYGLEKGIPAYLAWLGQRFYI
jgi:nucleoside-diphosphate-sugar epimerase